MLYKIIISCLLFLSWGCVMAETNQNSAPQEVHSVNIPTQVEFAGEKISLERHDLRERFDRELLAFTFMHSTTFMLIKRANLYFPLIEPILKANNIPDDFKYLAVVESYLNPRAISSAQAGGIWQFLAGTGKEYGLEVTNQVDERFHLEKATVAATKYLQDSYNLFGEWAAAAAAYNAGKTRIMNSLESQRAESYFDLYLNEETSRYMFRILAAKEILSHPKKYGFYVDEDDFYHTVKTKTMEVNSSVANWADWAIENGSTYVQLKYYNHWIRDTKLDNPSGKIYQVILPQSEDLNYDPKKIKIHNKNWVE